MLADRPVQALEAVLQTGGLVDASAAQTPAAGLQLAGPAEEQTVAAVHSPDQGRHPAAEPETVAKTGSHDLSITLKSERVGLNLTGYWP